MNIRNWMYLFWTTLLIGAVSALVAGMVLQAADRDFDLLGLSGVGYNIVTMIMGGLMFSVLSQMGFFAYLTLNYIAMGMIRNKYVWNMLQLLLIIVVLFDLGYLRYLYFAEGQTLISYMGLPVVLLVLSLAVAYWKMKLTNTSAFIPTLFFMSVGTTLEAVPVLHMNNAASTLFMTIPLFACNAWQILRLHKLVNSKKS